jgi:hypothetical protein
MGERDVIKTRFNLFRTNYFWTALGFVLILILVNTTTSYYRSEVEIPDLDHKVITIFLSSAWLMPEIYLSSDTHIRAKQLSNLIFDALRNADQRQLRTTIAGANRLKSPRFAHNLNILAIMQRQRQLRPTDGVNQVKCLRFAHNLDILTVVQPQLVVLFWKISQFFNMFL